MDTKPHTAWVIETPNSFEPLKVKKHLIEPGTRIIDWVAHTNPLTREFSVPTICLVNGRAMMRDQWEYPVKEGDVVNFIAIPRIPIIIIIIVVLVVAALAVALLMPVPPTPGEGPESDPVYSVKGQANQIRLGEPIEVCYGRNRIFPSYASRPFYRYENNDQFQHSLFCLGQGEYDIEQILIGDTEISNYQEVEYEIIPPGSATTLFATNVITSAEAGGQTLLGPNEAEYVPDGWVGPFVANPTGTTTTRIEIDLTFPKGVYRMTSSGSLHHIEITVEMEKRLIDDSGNPLGGFTALMAPVTVEMRTATPQRRTYSATVPSGRYEVRLRRTSDKKLSTRAGNDVQWEAMRAYIETEEETTFGDVTLLAVRIRASNNLNQNTQNRFNVIATRKLPIHLPEGGFSEPTATRSIVWAMVDIFRSLYGGRMEEEYFDWDALHELDALYESRGDYFDWVFRDSTTVWASAQIVAKVGRAIPLLSGSQVTMKRDGPLDIPVAVFNQENIVQGSLQWDVKLWDLDEHDSIRVEYTEPATAYKQEQVIATLPGDTFDNPMDLRLHGCQSRTQAYREGMYMLAVNRYLRENVTFETGLEGYIPTYGDLIAICHDVPEWGSGGYVVNAVRGGGEAYHLWLSEPVSFTSGATHQILLRGRQAEVIGPLNAYETTDPQQVMIQTSQDLDFMLDGKSEPMLFLFGSSQETTKYMKVVRIEPQGGEVIRITAVAENSIVHSFDGLTAPDLGEDPFPPEVPDLPEVANLILTQVDGTLRVIQAAWSAALGAQYYVIQTSTDGENWREHATTTRTAVQMQVPVGEFWVRVAGVNSGQGPWVEDSITISALASLEVSIPWDALEWEVKWWEVLNAVGYQVKVYDATDPSNWILKRTTILDPIERSFKYSYTEAVADSNVVREMAVEVDPMFDDEDTGLATPSGAPVSEEFSNAISEPPGEPITATLLSEDSDYLYYKFSWTYPVNNTEIGTVKLWISEVSGFDATVDPPVVTFNVMDPSNELVHAIEIDSSGGHPTLYYRIALFDVWGNELTTNLSAEKTLPAYP